METLPVRQIRAAHDDETLTVYQAYSPAVAVPALDAGTFVAPFKRERMTWKQQLRESPVRVQWDPERSTDQQELPHRALQLGLTDEAVHRYVDEWIVGISDVTALAHEAHALVLDHHAEGADALIPAETPYPLAARLSTRIGATAEDR